MGTGCHWVYFSTSIMITASSWELSWLQEPQELTPAEQIASQKHEHQNFRRDKVVRTLGTSKIHDNRNHLDFSMPVVYQHHGFYL